MFHEDQSVKRLGFAGGVQVRLAIVDRSAPIHKYGFTPPTSAWHGEGRFVNY
jgi:hypothetical protein